jgi:hypothetical protein
MAALEEATAQGAPNKPRRTGYQDARHKAVPYRSAAVARRCINEADALKR